MQPEDVAMAFVEAINAHDVDGIVGLCAEDHQFIDAHGMALSGDKVRAAWTGYFDFMPRYGIDVDEIIVEGEVVAIFGTAWGELGAKDGADGSWRRPCAWRARVEQGRIALWQVYVDTKVVFDLLHESP